jgi:hypothetical protein
MELEVRIERLGAQGDGVAQGPDGLLFVPFTLPGERVQVAIEPSKDHAEPLAILEPSPDRVATVCPHSGSAAAMRSSIWRAKPTLPGNTSRCWRCSPLARHRRLSGAQPPHCGALAQAYRLLLLRFLAEA